MVRPVQEKDTGLRPLYEPDDPQLDIVAIHGIGAHPYDTWVQRNEDGEKINWLENQDMLPAIAPHARIMRYGYRSAWFGSDRVRAKVGKIAERFLRALERKRDECPTRPIIFVAHCFGGVVLMRALSLSYSLEDDRRKIFESTTGIAFFSTPFRGTTSSFTSKLVTAMTSKWEDEVDVSVLQTLDADDQLLQVIMEEFGRIRNKPNPAKVACFTEMAPAPIARLTGRDEDKLPYVVSSGSGCLDGVENIELERHHFNINKFESQDQEAFEEVAYQIRAMVNATPGLMTARKEYTGDLFKIAFTLESMPTTDRFIGRESILKKLDEYLDPKRTSGRKVFLLHGLGGIGKTQLAVKFAREYESRYSAVFWLDGATKSNLRDSFSRIHQRISSHLQSEIEDGTDNKQDKEISEVQRWLCMPGNKHWLIIVDNVDYYQSDSKDSKSYDLEYFLPKAEHGSILITSRLSSAGQRFGDLRVDSVTEKEACDILNVNASSNPRDLPYWKPLINKLEGLPLALALAGSYVGTLGLSVKEYVKLYDSSWSELVNEHELRHDYKERTLLTTWQISVQRASEKDCHVKDLLRIWAVLGHNDIWYELFALQMGGDISISPAYPAWMKEVQESPIIFQRMMKILLEFSLIFCSKDRSSYSMHPVVHKWCKGLMNNEQYFTACQTAGTMLVHSPGLYENSAQKLRIRQHALPVTEYWAQNPCTPPPFLYPLGLFLFKDQDFEKAIPLLNRAAESYELRGKLVMALECYDHLYQAYRTLEARDEQKEIYNKACQTYKRILRTQDPRAKDLSTIILAHERMGLIHMGASEFDEAELVYLQMIIDCKSNGKSKSNDDTHRATLFLANLYHTQGENQKAVDLLLSAVTSQSTCDKSRSKVPELYYLLGVCYVCMGKFDDATEFAEKAVKAFEKTYGVSGEQTLLVRQFLGMVYNDARQFDKAAALLGPTHQTYASFFNQPNQVSHRSAFSLGHAYCATNRPARAAELFRSILRISEKELPSLCTLDTAKAATGLALALSHQGEPYRDVTAYFEWSIGSYKNLEGEKSWGVINVKLELFRWQLSQGCVEIAEELVCYLFRTTFQTLKAERLVLYLACIAADFGNKKQFDLAEKVQALAVQNLAMHHAPTSRVLLDSIRNLDQVKRWKEIWTTGQEVRCGLVQYSCHHVRLQETTPKRTGALVELRIQDESMRRQRWRQFLQRLAEALYHGGFFTLVDTIPLLDLRLLDRAFVWLAASYGNCSLSSAERLFLLSDERCSSHDTESRFDESRSTRYTDQGDSRAENAHRFEQGCKQFLKFGLVTVLRCAMLRYLLQSVPLLTQGKPLWLRILFGFFLVLNAFKALNIITRWLVS
ncbi:uncharacterized protein IWZ02DRAFT_437536 [Phyllosticta citriasiana]|uniref:uncharacterized protein n=1 Tax=Phyllosticta citriasiana TaxID=595635 RepID=UPI0030FD7755